jgi:hypothetical protein
MASVRAVPVIGGRLLMGVQSVIGATRLNRLEQEVHEAWVLLRRLSSADLVQLALAVGRGGPWNDLLVRMVRAELVRRRRVNDDEKRPVR